MTKDSEPNGSKHPPNTQDSKDQNVLLFYFHRLGRWQLFCIGRRCRAVSLPVTTPRDLARAALPRTGWRWGVLPT
jgi:hypothetical protein